jgi:hypothetical protein
MRLTGVANGKVPRLRSNECWSCADALLVSGRINQKSRSLNPS